MTKVRLRVVALSLLCCALVAAVVSQVGLGGSEKVRIGTGAVSVLSRSARASDSLPASVLAYPFAARNFASASGAGSRLVRVEGTLALYAVPGKAGMLCLIEVDEQAQTAGGACAQRSTLLTGSIYMADREEDGSRQVVGLVGDGHTYAESNGKKVRVEGNVFVLRDGGHDDVTIGSPTAEQTIELGD
jgi:hypothetical protein